jgi:hypothetical protein
MGTGCLGDSGYVTNCMDGTTPQDAAFANSTTDKPCDTHHSLTTASVLVAPGPKGPWSAAPSIPNCANGEPWFDADGTAWVACPWSTNKVDDAKCNGRNAFLQMYRADSWNGTYSQLPLSYSLAGDNYSKPCFNWEDQTVWRDRCDARGSKSPR